jgi:hypothetical protein
MISDKKLNFLFQVGFSCTRKSAQNHGISAAIEELYRVKFLKSENNAGFLRISSF